MDLVLAKIATPMARGNPYMRPGRYCKRRRVRMSIYYTGADDRARRIKPLMRLCAIHAARVASWR